MDRGDRLMDMEIVQPPTRELMVQVAAVVLNNSEDDDEARMFLDMLFRPVHEVGNRERNRLQRLDKREQVRKALLDFREF